MKLLNMAHHQIFSIIEGYTFIFIQVSDIITK